MPYRWCKRVFPDDVYHYVSIWHIYDDRAISFSMYEDDEYGHDVVLDELKAVWEGKQIMKDAIGKLMFLGYHLHVNPWELEWTSKYVP